MVSPQDTKEGAEASEAKSVETFFLAAVRAPRLTAVKQTTEDARGVDPRRQSFK